MKTAWSNFSGSAKNQIIIVETGKTKGKIVKTLQSSRTHPTQHQPPPLSLNDLEKVVIADFLRLKKGIRL